MIWFDAVENGVSRLLLLNKSKEVEILMDWIKS